MTRAPQSAAERFLILEDRALIEQCDVDHYRACGPGGQKRNKTSSAIRLRHRPTGLAVAAADDRSQRVNKTRALRRLRRAIAFNVRRDIDLARYTPSEMLASCITRDGAFRVSPRNARYYPVVCEVLDVVTAYNARVSKAAECVGVSTAHLVKFIRRDPKLWERVNQMRAGAGIKALR